MGSPGHSWLGATWVWRRLRGDRPVFCFFSSPVVAALALLGWSSRPGSAPPPRRRRAAPPKGGCCSLSTDKQNRPASSCPGVGPGVSEGQCQGDSRCRPCFGWAENTAHPPPLWVQHRSRSDLAPMPSLVPSCPVGASGGTGSLLLASIFGVEVWPSILGQRVSPEPQPPHPFLSSHPEPCWGPGHSRYPVTWMVTRPAATLGPSSCLALADLPRPHTG